MVELLRIPSLPFAVGLYLPLTTTLAVFAGGFTRWFTKEGNKERQPGVLFGSGLIAGDAMVGIALSILMGFVISEPWLLRGKVPVLSIVLSSRLFSLAVFAGLTWLLTVISRSYLRGSDIDSSSVLTKND